MAGSDVDKTVSSDKPRRWPLMLVVAASIYAVWFVWLAYVAWVNVERGKSVAALRLVAGFVRNRTYEQVQIPRPVSDEIHSERSAIKDGKLEAGMANSW